MKQNKAGPKDCQGEMLLRENSPRMGSRDEGLTRCWDEIGHSPTASQFLPTAHLSLRDISSTKSYTLPHAHHHIFAFTSGNNRKRNRKAMGGQHRVGAVQVQKWAGLRSFSGCHTCLHTPTPTPKWTKPVEKRIYKPGVGVHTFDLSMWRQLGSLWIGFETQLHSYPSLGYSKHCPHPSPCQKKWQADQK